LERRGPSEESQNPGVVFVPGNPKIGNHCAGGVAGGVAGLASPARGGGDVPSSGARPSAAEGADQAHRGAVAAAGD
jgi:hypothetical protein